MNINNIDSLKNIVSKSTFDLANKIKDELYDNIIPKYSYDAINENAVCKFVIPSFNYYRSYNTKIIFLSTGKIIRHSCDCKTYLFQGMCEHVCASIIIVNNEKENIYNYLNIKPKSITNPLIDIFKSDSKIKKKIPISIELIKESIRSEKGYYELKIEIDSYVLRKNINEFYETYYTNQGSLVFGKNFIYSPKLYYFSEKDKGILEILPLVLTQKTTYSKNNYSIDNNYLSTYSYKSKVLFDSLKNLKKEFTLTIDGVSLDGNGETVFMRGYADITTQSTTDLILKMKQE